MKPWPGKRVARFRVQQDNIARPRFSALDLSFQGEKQLGVQRHDYFLSPLPGYTLHLLPEKV